METQEYLPSWGVLETSLVSVMEEVRNAGRFWMWNQQQSLCVNEIHNTNPYLTEAVHASHTYRVETLFPN